MLGDRLLPHCGQPLQFCGGDLFEALARLEAAGCRRFVHTEVARDGMLAGPATERLREVLAATARPVVASGGVAGPDDLRALAALEPDGLEGVIVGKALYAGRLTVAEALAVLAAAAPGGPAAGTASGGEPGAARGGPAEAGWRP